MILEVPRAAAPAYQHCLDTYASESNKLAATWLRFTAEDWDFRIHPKSSSTGEILNHQLLSERRFFAFTARALELASNRLGQLAKWQKAVWLQTRNFFDVERQSIWIFWRRILHAAIYGPSDDETWAGADPTINIAAADRK